MSSTSPSSSLSSSLQDDNDPVASFNYILDPLLTSFLLRSVRGGTGIGTCAGARIDDCYDRDASDGARAERPSSMSQFTFADATIATNGLRVWEMSLKRSRLPLVDDFAGADDCHGGSTAAALWPMEPLFARVRTVLSDMGIQRLIDHHPTLLTSILLLVAKVVVEYIDMERAGRLTTDAVAALAGDAVDENEKHVHYGESIEDEEEEVEEEDSTASLERREPYAAEELAILADSLAQGLVVEWNDMVEGVHQLDKIFGYDHGLMNLQVGDRPTYYYPSSHLNNETSDLHSNILIHTTYAFILPPSSRSLQLSMKNKRTGKSGWILASQRMEGDARITTQDILHVRIARVARETRETSVIEGGRNAEFHAQE